MIERMRARPPIRWLPWLILASALLVVGAHAHLVYVAVRSQPDCVAHLKARDDGRGYRAAMPAC
ncbi:hypothetical protein [Prosthecomicrobium sp. N25]|uniref:hypothetical protein n=1 Tax=Prosthecomicrobium sp. N25 TaxID=3129254 RepID=UPI0030787CB0